MTSYCVEKLSLKEFDGIIKQFSTTGFAVSGNNLPCLGIDVPDTSDTGWPGSDVSVFQISFGCPLFLDQASSEQNLIFGKITDDIIGCMSFTNKTRFDLCFAERYFNVTIDRTLRKIRKTRFFHPVDGGPMSVRINVVFMGYFEPCDAVCMEMGGNHGFYVDAHLAA